MVEQGVYRHYKGGFYKLLGFCRIEAQGETGEIYVVYTRWGDDRYFWGNDNSTAESPWWCCPLSEWQDLHHVPTRTDEEKIVKRFTEVNE